MPENEPLANLPSTTSPPTPEKDGGKSAKPEPPVPKDAWREGVETVVFVLVLVLMLKAFVAEAFVIPSGSMAPTNYGDNRDLVCNDCGYRFALNAHEGEAGQRNARLDNNAICPNCHNWMQFELDHALGGGDKVLVSKTQYTLFDPRRFDVIVFKYPGKGEGGGGPQEKFAAKNFIKRLWGLPGERLAIWYGDVYLCDDANRLNILRKPLDKMLEMRRIVYDNDFQSKSLPQSYRRWQGVSGDWRASPDGKELEVAKPGKQESWLRYHHLLRTYRGDAFRQEPAQLEPKPQARLVTDFIGYNSGTHPEVDREGRGRIAIPDEVNSGDWVGDLMIDCEVEVTSAGGELIFELAEGVDRHQAIFDLQTGKCTLSVTRYSVVKVDGKETLKIEEIKRAEAETSLTGVDTHRVRFANFDNRLTLWVNGKLPFNEGLEFEGPDSKEHGPRLADLRPAGIGVRNAGVKVRRLQLWRDIYYTRVGRQDNNLSDPEATLSLPPNAEEEILKQELEKLGDPAHKKYSAAEQQRIARHRGVDAARWRAYYLGGQEPGLGMPEPAFYPSKTTRLGVGEYFVFGDNSTHSDDSRSWGVVPEYLLLGKAVLIYWPFGRFGMIH